MWVRTSSSASKSVNCACPSVPPADRCERSPLHESVPSLTLHDSGCSLGGRVLSVLVSEEDVGEDGMPLMTLESLDRPLEAVLYVPVGEGYLIQPGMEVRIVEERFPVKSRLHKGWKGTMFNTFFVGTFNALPRSLVRRFGWHLLAFCRK